MTKETDFKMDLLKKALNFSAANLQRLIPAIEAKTELDFMLIRIYNKLLKVAVSDEKLLKRDKNFTNFLHAFFRGLLYISQNDRYYRMWMGATLSILKKELEKFPADMKEESFQDADAFQLNKRLLDFIGVE